MRAALISFFALILPGSAWAGWQMNEGVTPFIQRFSKVTEAKGRSTVPSKNCIIEVRELNPNSLWIQVKAPFQDLSFSMNTQSSTRIDVFFREDVIRAEALNETDCESAGCSGPFELDYVLEVSPRSLRIEDRDMKRAVTCELQPTQGVLNVGAF